MKTKRKLLKSIIVVALIMQMTSVNLILLGHNIALAVSDNTGNEGMYSYLDTKTNNKNVEFSAYFKDENGNIVTENTNAINSESLKMYLYVNVKQEGYFNGEINLTNSNFTFKTDTKNDYIKKIESKKIVLNQVNAGNQEEIEIPIQSDIGEQFEQSKLSLQSNIELKGVYKNGEKKDVEINTTKDIKLNLVSGQINKENIKNDVNVITNKKAIINGEEKRIVQLELQLGLANNEYPIKNITAQISVPKLNGKEPKIEENVQMNNMQEYEFNYSNGILEIKMKNEENEQNNKILWNKKANEKVILTYIYDEYKDIQDTTISLKQKIVLQDNKEIISNTNENAILNNEYKDSIIKLNMYNYENSIYKGNLYANIDRDIKTKLKIDVTANIAQDITIGELQYNKDNGNANIQYKTSYINKQQIVNVLGEEFTIKIINTKNSEIIAELNKETRNRRKWKYSNIIS